MVLFYSDSGPVNLRAAVLPRVQLQDSYLYHVDFTGADLRSSNLADSDLGEAELSNANLDGSTIDNADFENATGQGSTWSEVKWWKAQRISPSLCRWFKQSDSKASAVPPGASNPCL